MIEFETYNVEGIKIKRSFHSISEILKKWWDEDDIDLPDHEDSVQSLCVNGQKILPPKTFGDLIYELEVWYWKEVIL